MELEGVKRDRLGRPNHGWSHINTRRRHYEARQMVSLSKEDSDALGEIARREGVTRSELIRTFVVWGIETEKREQQ